MISASRVAPYCCWAAPAGAVVDVRRVGAVAAVMLVVAASPTAGPSGWDTARCLRPAGVDDDDDDDEMDAYPGAGAQLWGPGVFAVTPTVETLATGSSTTCGACDAPHHPALAAAGPSTATSTFVSRTGRYAR